MIDPSNAMYLVVGSLFIAGTAALLFLNFSDRLNRVFALYLFLEGGAMITLAIEPTDGWQGTLRRMFPYLVLGTSFPILYLAACYRERFGRPGLRRLALPVLLLAALSIELAHLFDPTLFFGNGERPLRSIHYVLIVLGPAFMAALLGDDALRTNDPARRGHLLVASLAFAFYPTAFALHLFIPGLMNTHPLESWTALVGIVPVVYIVSRLGQVAYEARSAALRRAARRYLLILALSPASVALLWLVTVLAPSAGNASMRYIMTGWLVVLAALVGYAVLRHQLFGIEMGLKWTLRRGWIPSALVGIVFVTLQIGEQFAENQLEEFSWVFAGIAAATVGSLYRPIQKRMDRLAAKTMPEVENTTQYVAFRRLQLYQSALAAVWEDGVMHRDERVRLERLRKKLGISDQDAQELEAEFIRLSEPRRVRRRPTPAV